jgi:hypothetical protein
VTIRRLAVSVLFATLSFAALGSEAFAYPQFQFSSGTTRCSQCHYSPAGGGLITQWGRDESGDTISLGGDGGFLHGAWSPPSWLALGADVRFALTRTDDGGQEAPRGAFFPMQGDLYARVAFNDQFSLYVQGGARGEVRPLDDSQIGRLKSTPDRLISREHYLMWRPSATGPYARLGRFYAPYGIRFVEHIYYVRRFLGFNLYDETYTASGGFVGEEWELHVSAFTPPPSSFPNPLQAVGARESGGAAYFERRVAGMAAVGAQARVGIGSEASRYQGGAVGKLWLEPAKVLVLGQADLVRQQVSAGGGVSQFVSYLGATVIPIRGVMVGLAYERFQEDLSVKRTGHNAFDLQASFFPWAHFEVLLLGRYQLIGTGASDGPATSLLMAQLHYYL